MNCKFISPAKYEQEIVVVTSIKELSRARISFSYKVCDAVTNKVLSTGETMHAWTNKDFKPINAEKVIPEIYSKFSST
jgi:acyl-CoA thioester hydrolase